MRSAFSEFHSLPESNCILERRKGIQKNRWIWDSAPELHNTQPVFATTPFLCGLSLLGNLSRIIIHRIIAYIETWWGNQTTFAPSYIRSRIPHSFPSLLNWNVWPCWGRKLLRFFFSPLVTVLLLLGHLQPSSLMIEATLVFRALPYYRIFYTQIWSYRTRRIANYPTIEL